MMMEEWDIMSMQNIIDFGISAVLATIGWGWQQIWSSLQDMKKNVHNIEIDLPKNYLSKEEYHVTMNRIENMFDKIDKKLDAKKDKP